MVVQNGGSRHKAAAVLVRSLKLRHAEGKNVMIIIRVSPQRTLAAFAISGVSAPTPFKVRNPPFRRRQTTVFFSLSLPLSLSHPALSFSPRRGERIRAAVWKPEGEPVRGEHEGQRPARPRPARDPQQLDQPHGERRQRSSLKFNQSWP